MALLDDDGDEGDEGDDGAGDDDERISKGTVEEFAQALLER